MRCRPVPDRHDPRENHILDALPAEERERLFPHLGLVEMPLGMVLYESGEALRHIYFPTDSIVSLLYVMEDGASAEIAVVGNDGAVGVSLFMGGETTPSRAIVQSAGFAYRLSGQRLKEEFERHGQLLHVLLRYTQSLITQMAQTAVCNRHHSVDQQLCRWLLLSLDRLPSNRFEHDPRADRQHARRAARRRDRSGWQAARARRDSTTAAGISPCSTGPSSRRCRANAMPWSSRKQIACNRLRRPSDVRRDCVRLPTEVTRAVI